MAKSSIAAILLLACAQASAALCADGPKEPDQTIAAMKVYGDLEAKLFAAEPMITNPTNIAIDARGRVWVCDVVNYRGNQGKRSEGDRILILEDEDGDGRADKSTVFYQGHDVDSALGICVLGEKVIVSCSPDVFVLTDEDGDGRADRKQILYTKTGTRQHDHSAHAFVFGPDGCLYWNVGNEHQGVFDAEGNVVRDLFGREVRRDGKPFRHGMAFRQRLDGSEFEVLAHNLRNSYELTVDAFGDVWFTDNDDDGNRGTRFCFTLNGGNYGYTDELTGRGWRSNRLGSSTEIPIRHWHQNDPGSIPNVLNNGSGSPSGVEAYEAKLLPSRIYGGIIHCEPGHNVVRVYLPRAEGAGYSADTVELIDGRGDPWFRPVDVATAPDGSLLIADWYDPGVGGHRQADIQRGRIYRVAPKASTYRNESLAFNDVDSACQLLCSGNNSVRYAAWQTLAEVGTKAEDALTALSSNDDPRARARAFWLLTRLATTGESHLQRASDDPDPRVRAAATRMTRNVDISTAQAILTKLIDDPSAQVRRSVAIALRRYHEQEFAPRLWARLAQQYDGQDRWFLEALGLAAEFGWDRCLDAWFELAGDDAWRSPAGRMLIWRSRGTKTLEMLTSLLSDSVTSQQELPRLLRALQFNSAEAKQELLLGVAESALAMSQQRKRIIVTEVLRQISWNESNAAGLNDVLQQHFRDIPRDENFADLVMRFRQQTHYDELLTLAVDPKTDDDYGIRLLRYLVRQDHLATIRQRLAAADPQAATLARMLALTGERSALELLQPLVLDSGFDIETRRELVRALTTNKSRAEWLVRQDETGNLSQELQSALVFALRVSPWTLLSQRANDLHPELVEQQSEQLPVAQWMKMRGQAKRGKDIFNGKANCATCHKVGEAGKEVGPALTEIGSKLSHTGLYEAILYPSAAVSHNYETYVAMTDAGTAIKGVLLSETDDTVTLKTEKATVHELRRDELEDFKKQQVSLMPDGLHKLITPQEMADLVAYLSQLKKKSTDQ